MPVRRFSQDPVDVSRVAVDDGQGDDAWNVIRVVSVGSVNDGGDEAAPGMEEMQVITYRGRLGELTVLGDTVNDELVLECWDMSADGGRWFTLSRDADGVMILKGVQRPLPLDLLEQVAAIAGIELTEQ